MASKARSEFGASLQVVSDVLDCPELLVADDDEPKPIATKKYTRLKLISRPSILAPLLATKNIALVPAAFAEFGAFKQSRP
jgi:hypothetical protein